MRKVLQALFRAPTPVMLAARELRDAELCLLQAQTAKEWADSVIGYNVQRIKRLRGFLAQEALVKEEV